MNTTSYMNEQQYLEAKAAHTDPGLSNGTRVSQIYDKNANKLHNDAEETLSSLKASVETNDDAEALQKNLRNTYAYQNMILSNMVNTNNLSAAQINTLRRKYQILKYEEEKNQDRNRIMTNLVIVLLSLVIATILYKKGFFNYETLVMIFSVSAIFIGFYMAYQYYYDYYVRDRIFYNQIYSMVRDEEEKENKCPVQEGPNGISQVNMDSSM